MKAFVCIGMNLALICTLVSHLSVSELLTMDFISIFWMVFQITHLLLHMLYCYIMVAILDKTETHIISSILHVDHDPMGDPWPIVIEDFQGNLNEGALWVCVVMYFSSMFVYVFYCFLVYLILFLSPHSPVNLEPGDMLLWVHNTCSTLFPKTPALILIFLLLLSIIFCMRQLWVL